MDETHVFRANVKKVSLPLFMEKTDFDSTNVLIWGVVLLGGIGFFVVWGLTNAYP
jgi:hypothetical protein|tara:strand:- start:246 stop:410 length:165 start_codon:yes stop_codon:yes gene_type:complete